MIIIPKVGNLEAEAYITVGLTIEQYKEIKKEAKEKQWSMSKTLRNKAFPKK